MARYDEITESNWLTKKEILIQKTLNFFLVFTLLDFFSIIFRPIRHYHFNNFPNFHLIGIVLLFILTVKRIIQGSTAGRNPYMDASVEWRDRKGMIGAYDYIGPGPDYSNKKHNIIYFVGVLIGLGLIITEAINHFK